MDWLFGTPGPKIKLGEEYPGGFFPKDFTLKAKEITSHKLITGMSDVGKSYGVVSLLHQYQKLGIPYSFYDPAGSASELILAYLADARYFEQPSAFDKLWYIPFTDGPEFFPMNPWDNANASEAEIASLTVESLRRGYPEIKEGAVNLYKILDAATKVLIANGLTLASLEYLIQDDAFRRSLYPRVTDYTALNYFQNEYDRIDKRLREMQRSSLVNRAYDLNASPVLRYCLGAPVPSKLDPLRFMNEGITVLYDTSGLRDTKTRRLVANFIIHPYEKAALSRNPTNPGLQHHLVIDEAGQILEHSSVAMEDILDYSRKFGLYLTIIHQHFQQLGQRTQGSLANMRVRISFRVGPEDALIQAKALGILNPTEVRAEARSPTSNDVYIQAFEQQQLLAQDYMNLPKQTCYVRVDTGKAKLIKTPTLPTPRVSAAYLDQVKAEYKRRLLVKKSDVQMPMPPTRPGPTSGGFGGSP